MQFQREQTLLLSIIHADGMKTIRGHLGNQPQLARPTTTSWLATQRKNVRYSLVQLTCVLTQPCSLDKHYADNAITLLTTILICSIPHTAISSDTASFQVRPIPY